MKNNILSEEHYAEAEKAFGKPRFSVVREEDNNEYKYDHSLISDGQRIFRIEVDEDGRIRFAGEQDVRRLIEMADGNIAALCS